METQTLARCARCVAGLCGHPDCGSHAKHAITEVAGTPTCKDCTGPLLDLVLHPLQPETVHGIKIIEDSRMPPGTAAMVSADGQTVPITGLVTGGGGNSGP